LVLSEPVNAFHRQADQAGARADTPAKIRLISAGGTICARLGARRHYFKDMLLLAAAAAAANTTALDKIEKIPPMFWLKVVLGIVGFIAVVIALRKIAGMNKVVLAVIGFIVFVVVGINWIYERNEPAFMTPVISKIAPFFPSKGSYGGKQTTGPKI